MMRAIVLVLCLVAAGGITVYTQYSQGGSGEPVYTVPARPAAAPAALPSAPAAARSIDPEDKAGLARALQRELKRVGCYNGEITGVWTTSSRMAMKAFVERANAALPVDNPDPVLLSLVQGRQERACGVACPAGQAAAEGGACVPTAVLAKTAREPPAEIRTEAEKPADAAPAAGAAAAAVGTAAALTVPAPRGAKSDVAKPDAKGATSEWKTSTASPARSAAASAGSPVPPEGMAREHRPRRSAEAQPQPPKVVRDVLRALGFK